MQFILVRNYTPGGTCLCKKKIIHFPLEGFLESYENSGMSKIIIYQNILFVFTYFEALFRIVKA